MLRRLLKRSMFLVALVQAFRALKKDLSRLRHYFRRQSVMRHYLATHGTRKLHLAAGYNTLDGWLNTDIERWSDNMAYLDVTGVFPFEEGTFDYVFSEHLIEHLNYRQGLLMLQECYRVLKPGGRLRIATPDLEHLTGLLAGSQTRLQRRYIRWATDEHIAYADAYRASLVINNFFYDFGHQFIYDRETLESCIRSAGFTKVAGHSPRESHDENLRGLESHGKWIGEQMNRLQTMVFEAIRPAQVS